MPSDAKPDYANLDLPDPPPHRPYVFTNMVISADGKVVVEGTEQGLGSPTDQRLLRELRASADAVLNGAETLRVSGSSPRVRHDDLLALRKARGLPPNPIGVVLSRSGDLPLDAPFFTADDFRAVVFLSPDAPADRKRALVATGREIVELPPHDPLPWMLRYLREQLAVRYLVVEGGPRVNGALFDQGLVDEYFLTLAPRVVGGRNTLAALHSDRDPSRSGMTQLALISALPNPETGELYLRYRIVPPGAPRP